MLNASPQAPFGLTVSDLKHAPQTLSLTSQKAFSAAFSFDLKRVSERPDLDIENLQSQVLEEGLSIHTHHRKNDEACKKGVCLTEGAAA